ncbi:hypothetical protein NLI96_g394 [Meripilus lineatus]|uniref:Zn(2)-C6 fungal-type domain-containing protein n=1 Tax=Meripilus lineatus TaxID=2056292 RepID=A0AAD5YJE0_9APHY|nr:hypothetical protein NLI96_g394 [Physisporinus lineatus]
MPSSSSYAPPLERGKACLKCRSRKMRCDGIRPMCGPCARAGEVECEYTDGGEAPSQVLQRRAEDLQAQIHTLEGQSNQPITLHNPYNQQGGSSSDRRGGPQQAEAQISAALLQGFLSQAKNCGFFLNTGRFVERLNPRASGSAPLPPALSFAAQVVGTLFVQDARLRSRGDQIASRAAQYLGSTQADPSNVILLLQAEVLLAFYHFFQNQSVQGQIRMTAATSMALAWGLHTSQMQRGPAAAGVLGRYRLPPPIDPIEAGERINAFWTVFCLERRWCATQGLESRFPQDEVCVPWPLNMSDYEQGDVPHFAAGATGMMTVKTFLEGQGGHETDRSVLSLLAKASILFQKSADLVKNWAPNAAGFQQSFFALDRQIEEFKRTLPSIPTTNATHQREGSPTDLILQTRSLLLVHTLVQCATLQLYLPRQERDLSRSRAFNAASTASGLLQRVDVRNLGYVDPFMGVLWSNITDALMRWLMGLRRARPASSAGSSSSGSPQRAPPHPFEGNITSCLDCLSNAIGTLVPKNPWIESEYRKLQQFRGGPPA